MISSALVIRDDVILSIGINSSIFSVNTFSISSSASISVIVTDSKALSHTSYISSCMLGVYMKISSSAIAYNLFAAFSISVLSISS